jgi:hypothetical protein|nr:MAG TPA: hypothetical protein [Caudoviricetes sp.]
MGGIFVRDNVDSAVKPKKIFAGNNTNTAVEVKAIFVGNNTDTAVKVWPEGVTPGGTYTVSWHLNVPARGWFWGINFADGEMYTTSSGTYVVEKSSGYSLTIYGGSTPDPQAALPIYISVVVRASGVTVIDTTETTNSLIVSLPSQYDSFDVTIYV